MSSLKTAARKAGLPGFVVYGDAATTAPDITTAELASRVGILGRMSVRHRARLSTPTAAFALMMVGCTASYTPGLGELMSAVQMRHVKLWLAGQERNRQLAQYERDELQEGFGDVVRFHPSHKDSPLPLSQLLPRIMAQPMSHLRDAIKARDERVFVTAYDELTNQAFSVGS